MEPGHPDLAGYEFFTAELHLTKLWLINDESRDAAEAEFILASSCKHQEESRPLQQLLRSPDFVRPELLTTQRLGRGNAHNNVFFLTQLPRRGWNHGEDVGAMLEELQAKRPANLGASLARWALNKIPLAQFGILPSAQTFRHFPSYEFPLVHEFTLNTEMVAVEWEAPHIGNTNQTNLHVLDFDFS